MKRLTLSLAAIALLGMTACQDQNNDVVVMEKYVHKYGYTVSKEEWNAKKYPGQVITTMRDGVTVTATYEDGLLHGPSTNTYPHSQTVESYYLYSKGSLAKEIKYDIRGIPQKEVIYQSPSISTTTLWFEAGTPRSIEEYESGELLSGQYFSSSNETEARVVNGNGERVNRDLSGTLLSKEFIENSAVTSRQAFHSNGTPESIANYENGRLHGEMRTFNLSGEPESIEHYVDGKLQETSIYFKNGCKFMEIAYEEGKKQGDEIHYIDGDVVSQKIHWEHDKKHGPSTFYVDGVAHTKWYYNGNLVKQARYEELVHQNEVMQSMREEFEENL